MTLVRTPRLWLRPITLDDVEAVDALNRAPGVLRYLQPAAPSRDQVEQRIREVIGEARPGLERFVLTTDHGDFVGWCGVSRSEHAFEQGPFADADPATTLLGELGYRLRPEFWRQAFATEAAEACVERAFEVGHADAVFARTMAANAGSRGVMRRLGMRHVASYHEHVDEPLPGADEGEVRYEVTRAQWDAARVDPRVALRSALTRAMKSRDTDAVSALRLASSAVANAEALPASTGAIPRPEASADVAGASLGVGSADAERVWLSDAAVLALLDAERDDARAGGVAALDGVLAACRA